MSKLNLKIFPRYGKLFTGTLIPDRMIELWKDLSLRLIVKRFQRLCHIQFPSPPKYGVESEKYPLCTITLGVGGDFMQILSLIP